MAKKKKSDKCCDEKSTMKPPAADITKLGKVSREEIADSSNPMTKNPIKPKLA